MQSYRNILALSRLIRQKYQYIEQATGYNFNIFSILDRERYEVTTHSYFLYELLSPHGSHGQSDRFLQLFLEKILNLQDYGDLKTAKVERESLTSQSRRIDFVIETGQVIIGIEMKIDADDQKNQLADYYKELEYRTNEKKSVKLYYLTLDGKDASSYSLGSLDEGIVENISFEKEIFDWIKLCMEVSVDISIVREALKQYLVLIEKLTGKKENMMEELSELLLQGNNLADAIALEKSIEKAKIKIQKRFWLKLQEKLDETFVFVNFDFNHVGFDAKVNKFYELSNGNRYYGLKKDLLEKDGYVISYYIELHNKPYHGLTVAKKEVNDRLKRNGYADMDSIAGIKETIIECKLFSKKSAWWIGWKYFGCANEIDFYHFNEYALQLNHDQSLEQSVECMAREVNMSLEKVQTCLAIGTPE